MPDHGQDSQTQPEAWARLRDAFSLRLSGTQVLVGLLLMALGFAFAVQVRSTQEDALAGARTTDLVRILDDLGDQRIRLTAEASRLRATLAELETGADQAGAARQAARERLQTLGILAGTLRARGSGVLVSIGDNEGGVMAPQLLDAVQELRDAGAEAVQINNVRVVGSTSFIDSADGIVVDGTVVTPPYEIRAIGDPKTLASALAIPGGVVEGIREAGGRPSVTESNDVLIDALRPLPEAEYARPA